MTVKVPVVLNDVQTGIVAAFTDAQLALVSSTLEMKAAEKVFRAATKTDREAFVTSAVSCAVALATKGVTLAVLAAANVKAAEGLDEDAPKGNLYTSPTSITHHAIVGNIFQLPTVDGEKVLPQGATVQARVLRAADLCGVKVVKAVVKSATSGTDAYLKLAAEIKAHEAAAVVPVTESGEGDESDGADESGESFSAPLVDESTIAMLLSRVLASVEGGTTVTAADRVLLTEITAAFSPVALVAAV